MDTLGWILPDGDKDLERAAALLERAHEATPGSGTIGYHDAVALHRIGRDSAARQLLQSLLREDRTFSTLVEAQAALTDRKIVGLGKNEEVRVEIGGWTFIKKTKNEENLTTT